MLKQSISIPFIIILLIFSIIGISFGWDFILQGRIQETFDDNINSSITDKRYDFLSEFIVGLGVRHEAKTQTLDIIGHVTQQLYAMNFGLTNNAQDISLNYNKEFTERVSVQIVNVFQNFPEPDRFAALFGNVQGRMRYWRNNFNLNGIFEVSHHYVVNVTYVNQFSKYFYTRTRQWYINNYYTHNYTNQDLKYSFVQTARIQNEVHWDSSNNSYIFYEYQWTKSYPGGVLQVHRPGIGYRHDFTKQLYVEGRISPDFVFAPRAITANVSAYGIQYIIPPRTPYDISLYTYFILSHNADKKTNARLTFTFQNSVLANNAAPTTNWQILGDITRQIYDRLSLTSSLFYGQAYSFSNKTTNRLLGFSLATAYEFTEHISASISYNFTFNYSHVDGNRLFHGYIYNNGAYVKEDTGYLRNRVTVAFIAEL